VSLSSERARKLTKQCCDCKKPKRA
jgi:hypothetical protein